MFQTILSRLPLLFFLTQILNAQVLPLAQAPVCKTPDGFPANVGRGRTPPGDDLVRVQLNSPMALCNDGSAAVYYIRAATPEAVDLLDQPTANQWVIFLQGGGGCVDYDTCRDRWCGNSPFDASKMSSQWAPETIGAKGIFNRSAENNLGDRNQVFAYYCSSDSWTGRAQSALLEDPDNPGRSISLDLMGAHIFDALIDELGNGVASPDGTVQLPPLVEATDIILAGSSAGSGGVRHNVDRFRERMEDLTGSNKTHKGQAPTMQIRAVTDAGLTPDSEGVSGLPLGDPDDLWTQQLLRGADAIELREGRLDQSCLDLNPGTEYQCTDSAFVQLNHITTPFFARMDLSDPVGYRSANTELFPTLASFAVKVHDGLTSLADIRTAQGAAEFEDITVQPGAYGTLCGQHTALTNDDFFFNPVVQPQGGQLALSFHDALWNWLSGRNPIAQIARRPNEEPPTPPIDPFCNQDVASRQFVSISSASLVPGEDLTPEMIVSGFGPDLATEEALATELPLPTELAGTTVDITDSLGVTRMASLFYVGPTQINYLIPAGTALGQATITVRTPAKADVTGTAEIAPTSPGLYTANSQGFGVASAFYIRDSSDGTREQGLVYDPATGDPVPIDFGQPGDEVFLILFGTGMRGGNDGQLRAIVGGQEVPVLAVVPHDQFEGLDQANIGPLPPDLEEAGPVRVGLEIAGERTNLVGVVLD